MNSVSVADGGRKKMMKECGASLESEARYSSFFTMPKFHCWRFFFLYRKALGVVKNPELAAARRYGYEKFSEKLKPC